MEERLYQMDLKVPSDLQIVLGKHLQQLVHIYIRGDKNFKLISRWLKPLDITSYD